MAMTGRQTIEMAIPERDSGRRPWIQDIFWAQHATWPTRGHPGTGKALDTGMGMGGGPVI